MTAPVPQVRVRGLYTGRGLVDAPAGAMQVADNVVCLLPGTIEPRRGDELLSATARGSDSNEASAVAYAEHMLAHVDTGSMVEIIDADTDTAGSYAATMHPRGGIPMRALGRQAYLCTGDGVQIANATVSAPRSAGAQRMLDIVTLGTVGGVALEPSQRAAWRAVWGVRLVDSVTGETREQWGAPSAPRTLTNGGTASNVTVTLQIPPYASLQGGRNIVRLYRTESVASGVEPGDEMFLAAEQSVDPLATGTLVVTDSTPDAFLGAPLYTNADTGDGLGAAGANLTPPAVCSDVAAWESRVWYASYGTRGSFRVSLIGVDGIVIGMSTISFEMLDPSGTLIGALALEAASAPGAGQFQLVTGGTPAQNIEGTARSIVQAINADANAPVWASYVSSANDVPGQMEFWARDGQPLLAAVRVRVDDMPGGLFVPNLAPGTLTLEAAQVRYLDVRPGVLVWSKPGQPEAVPPLNSLLIGDPYEPIIALAGLRDGLIVAKTDGLYLVHGGAGQYGVQTLDASVRMPTDARMGGRGTCQVLNNELYLHASDGRVYVASESGVRAIDGDVLDMLRWASSSWGAVDERDGLYVLGLVGGGLGFTTRAMVYSSETRAWTRWAPLGVGAYRHWMTAWPRGGFASFLGSILRTRSSGTVSDYQDHVPGGTLTVGAPVGGVQAVTASTLGGLVTGSEIVNAANSAQRGVLLADGSILVTGEPLADGVSLNANVTNPVLARIQSVPWHGGQPAARKRFSAAELHFDRYGLSTIGPSLISAITPWAQFQREASLSGHSNVVLSPQDLTSGESSGGWSERVQPRSVRAVVPRDQQALGMLSVGLSVKQVRAFWRLAGWTLEVEAGLTKVAR